MQIQFGMPAMPMAKKSVNRPQIQRQPIQGGDQVLFSGKKPKKFPVTENTKLLVKLIDLTIKDELKWKRTTIETDGEPMGLEGNYVAHAIETKLKDGTKVKLGGDFLDEWAGEGLLMSVKPKGVKTMPLAISLQEVTEHEAAGLFHKVWNFNPDQDDANEIAKEYLELEKKYGSAN